MVHFVLAALVALAVQQDPSPITGTVRDGDGLAVAGAVVEARARDGVVARARTDADGRFAFARPFEDAVEVVVRGPGFAVARIALPRQGPLAPLIPLIPLIIVLQ